MFPNSPGGRRGAEIFTRGSLGRDSGGALGGAVLCVCEDGGGDGEEVEGEEVPEMATAGERDGEVSEERAREGGREGSGWGRGRERGRGWG